MIHLDSSQIQTQNDVVRFQPLTEQHSLETGVTRFRFGSIQSSPLSPPQMEFGTTPENFMHSTLLKANNDCMKPSNSFQLLMNNKCLLIMKSEIHCGLRVLSVCEFSATQVAVRRQNRSKSKGSETLAKSKTKAGYYHSRNWARGSSGF